MIRIDSGSGRLNLANRGCKRSSDSLILVTCRSSHGRTSPATKSRHWSMVTAPPCCRRQARSKRLSDRVKSSSATSAAAPSSAVANFTAVCPTSGTSSAANKALFDGQTRRPASRQNRRRIHRVPGKRRAIGGSCATLYVRGKAAAAGRSEHWLHGALASTCLDHHFHLCRGVRALPDPVLAGLRLG